MRLLTLILFALGALGAESKTEILELRNRLAIAEKAAAASNQERLKTEAALDQARRERQALSGAVEDISAQTVAERAKADTVSSEAAAQQQKDTARILAATEEAKRQAAAAVVAAEEGQKEREKSQKEREKDRQRSSLKSIDLAQRAAAQQKQDAIKILGAAEAARTAAEQAREKAAELANSAGKWTTWQYFINAIPGIMASFGSVLVLLVAARIKAMAEASKETSEKVAGHTSTELGSIKELVNGNLSKEKAKVESLTAENTALREELARKNAIAVLPCVTR